VRKWQHDTRRLPLCPLPRPNCPECGTIGWFNQGPIMTEDYLWGTSHLSGNGVFVLGKSIEIGAE
jgi:hypothetical protein